MTNEILEYLQLEYSRTKWPFFSVNQLKYRFGGNTGRMLNELFKSGYVAKRIGVNGPLVELKNT
jgi:hypothetical protein